jgi:hypothetical protein
MYLSRPLQSVLQQQSVRVDNGKFVETTPAAVRNGSKKDSVGNIVYKRITFFSFSLSLSLLEIIKTRKTDRFPATHLQQKSFENIPLALFYF